MKMRTRLLFLVMVILLTACRGGAVASPPVPLFPRQKDELDSVALEALFIGDLTIVDDCLRATDSDGHTVLPIWPHDFSLYVQGDAIQILDGDGYLVARVGDHLGIGGGEIPTSFARTKVDSSTQLILDACPGPYWLVGRVN